MKLAQHITPLVLRHWLEGGTGITNMATNENNRSQLYIKAAENLGMDGITVITLNMDGTPGCSLHDCLQREDLSMFWDEVRRINGGKVA